MAAPALVLALGVVGLAACEPQPPKPVDIYSFAGGCHALKDETTGKFVVKDAVGYVATAPDAAKATPFTTQATALGRYLLYGLGGHMPRVGALSTISSIRTPT